MAVDQNQLEFIEDQLQSFGGVTAKKMFGGIGFFREGLMFGMLGGGVFRLKVDEHNRADFEDRGMKPYQSKKKGKGMPYWEVPLDVLEDRSELKKWAEKSFDAAKRSKK